MMAGMNRARMGLQHGSKRRMIRHEFLRP